MKQLLSVILLFAAISLSAGEPLPVFAQREINLGAFKGDSLQTARFTVRNIGTDTLVIFRVFTECRCTRPESYSKTIAPGDSTILTVKYNGKGNIPGHIRQAITLRTNAAKPYLVGHITGEIIRPVQK